MTAKCEQEECPFWTGHGCVCEVLFEDRNGRDRAIAKLGLAPEVTNQ